jgi:hypothetical protein
MSFIFINVIVEKCIYNKNERCYFGKDKILSQLVGTFQYIFKNNKRRPPGAYYRLFLPKPCA